MIKSDFARSGFDFTVPVGAFSFDAQSEVPFADHSRAVAGFFHQVREGHGVLVDDEVSVGGRDSGPFFTKSVSAREKGIA